MKYFIQVLKQEEFKHIFITLDVRHGVFQIQEQTKT